MSHAIEGIYITRTTIHPRFSISGKPEFSVRVDGKSIAAIVQYQHDHICVYSKGRNIGEYKFMNEAVKAAIIHALDYGQINA